jgi:hypothetical protein
MKSKKGFQFFLEMEKIMGTSIFSGNGKNHGNINFFWKWKKSFEESIFHLRNLREERRRRIELRARCC